jgi:hypothetical protein
MTKDINLIFTIDCKGRKEKCRMFLYLVEKFGIESVMKEIKSIAGDQKETK